MVLILQRPISLHKVLKACADSTSDGSKEQASSAELPGMVWHTEFSYDFYTWQENTLYNFKNGHAKLIKVFSLFIS